MSVSASSPRARLSSSLVLGVRSLAATFDEYYSRHGHIVVETKDRQSGFALFGGWKARHLFQRLYLDSTAPLPARLTCHRAATAADCRALARKYGLVVFCGDSAPPDLASELLSIPVRVEMDMATPTTYERTGGPWTRGGVRDNIRRIRSSRFEYDIQQGDAWVPEFYTRMFRPSMTNRHGDEAYITSRRELSRHALGAGGELLRILQDGTWVAGCLNRSTADGYRLARIGWANGDPALLKAGVVSAVYWFSMQRASVLGQTRMLLGAVLPDLQDGLLQYKAGWGAGLWAGGRTFGHFRLLLEPSHPACRRFLRARSLIAQEGHGGDFTVFSARTPNALAASPGLLRSISRWYTWRDEPLTVPDVCAAEVPHPLRPWLRVRSLDGSGQVT